MNLVYYALMYLVDTLVFPDISILILLSGGLSVLSALDDLATRPSTAFVEPYDPAPKVSDFFVVLNQMFKSG